MNCAQAARSVPSGGNNTKRTSKTKIGAARSPTPVDADSRLGRVMSHQISKEAEDGVLELFMPGFPERRGRVSHWSVSVPGPETCNSACDDQSPAGRASSRAGRGSRLGLSRSRIPCHRSGHELVPV